MPEEKILIKDYEPDLPMDKIFVSPENVRHTQAEVGIEELKSSIERLGLIQPVIVIAQKDGKYRLIVGQRRFKAFQGLGRKTIPGLIIRKQLDPKTESIVSYGENVFRRKIPYNDTIAVCNELFKEYAGSRIDKIKQIAKELGLARTTVAKYLAYQLIPKKVRDLVQEKKLAADIAERITAGWWPNDKKILEISDAFTRLTEAERDRFLELGFQNPSLSTEKLVEEAKKVPDVIEITITISRSTDELLKLEAKKRETKVDELIRTAINTFLEEGA